MKLKDKNILFGNQNAIKVDKIVSYFDIQLRSNPIRNNLEYVENAFTHLTAAKSVVS